MNWLKNINTFFIVGLFSVIILAPQLVPMMLLGFALSSKYDATHARKYFSRAINWSSILFYLLIVASYFISMDKDFAGKDLTLKSLLLLVPLVLGFTRNEIDIKLILWVFVLSLILSGVIIQCYIVFNDLPLLGNHTSIYMHRSYYDMYLTAGISILLFTQLTKKAIITQGLTILFLSFLIFQNQSKAGLLILGVIFFIWLFKTLLHRIKWFPTLVVLVLFVFTLVQFINKNKGISERFGRTIKALNIENIDPKSVESNQARVLTWNASLSVIATKPIFGYGIGDGKHRLTQEQYYKGYTGIAKSELNSHNQFLTFGINMGIIGLLAYLLLYVSLFWSAYRHKSGILFFLGLILLLNSLVESTFELQVGIFYFSALILFYYKIGIYDTLLTTKD